jgi:hypothetical protein
MRQQRRCVPRAIFQSRGAIPAFPLALFCSQRSPALRFGFLLNYFTALSPFCLPQLCRKWKEVLEEAAFNAANWEQRASTSQLEPDGS